MIEIGRGERRVPFGREAPRAVIEALAGDVDIVAVEHAVDKTRGQIGCGECRGRAGDQVEQAQALPGSSPRFAVEMIEAVADELGDVVGLAEDGQPLESADADMAVAEPGQDRRAGRRRLVAALESSPVSNSAKVFDVLTPSASSISVARTSRTPPFRVSRPSARTAVGRLARALGAEVEQAAVRSSRSCANRKPRPSPMSGLYTRNWWP